MSKIVISGVGIVCPLAIETGTFYEALIEGECKNSLEKTAYKGHGRDCFSSRVSDEQKRTIDEVVGVDLPQSTKYGIYAIKKAIEDAGYSIEDLKGKRVSLYLGNNEAECEEYDDYIANGINLKNYKKYYSSSNIARVISEYFSFIGEAICIHNTCASSNIALEQAMFSLNNNESDIAITGGVDAFSLKVFSGFHSLRALSKTVVKPFSKDRDGIVISEGAGIMVLERMESLKEREKDAYCEVVSVGSSNDAYHLTSPNVEGVKLAIDRAIKTADIRIEDVDYIMAHGTGTTLNDKVESEAINQIFTTGTKPKICSIKGIIGHMMATAGAAASVAICLIYKNGIIPPSKSSVPIDESLNVDIILKKTQDEFFNIWINNAFGFGGNNSVVVFRRIQI